MIVNGGIAPLDFMRIAGSLSTFPARYDAGRGAARRCGPAEQIAAAVASRNLRIALLRGVHTRSPFTPQTSWFTLSLDDQRGPPRTIRIFVDQKEWNCSQVRYRRLSHRDDPAIPATADRVIGWFDDGSDPDSADWFR